MNLNKLIHKELDEWAFDLEQEYAIKGELSQKKRKQHFILCNLRDKYYEKYSKYIEGCNMGNGVRFCNMGKYCLKRISDSIPREPKRNKVF